MRMIVALLVLACVSSTAEAQSIDWKPIAASVPFVFGDTLSTERFIASSRCEETNSRYWGYNDFTPAQPDTAKMWRDHAIQSSAIILTTVAASRVKVRWVRWVTKGAIYAAGARAGYSTVRNIRKCGW